MKTKKDILRLLVMGMVVTSVMGASDCDNGGGKTPQGALNAAFEALEASNVALWDQTLVNSPQDPNEWRGATGMMNFKKLVGLQNVTEGKKLGLSAGNVSNDSSRMDWYGQLVTVYPVGIVLKKNPSDSNEQGKVVAEATVGCTDKPTCKVESFREIGR